MHMYQSWRFVFSAEILLIVLTLIFLGRQSWNAKSAEDIEREDSLSSATTHPLYTAASVF